MNVHKSFVSACIASTNEYGVTTYKGMNTTKEQVLAAVNRETCKDRAEKLCIIYFHIDSRALCKPNLEALILTAAEKIPSSTWACGDGVGYPILILQTTLIVRLPRAVSLLRCHSLAAALLLGLSFPAADSPLSGLPD